MEAWTNNACALGLVQHAEFWCWPGALGFRVTGNIKSPKPLSPQPFRCVLTIPGLAGLQMRGHASDASVTLMCATQGARHGGVGYVMGVTIPREA